MPRRVIAEYRATPPFQRNAEDVPIPSGEGLESLLTTKMPPTPVIRPGGSEAPTAVAGDMKIDAARSGFVPSAHTST